MTGFARTQYTVGPEALGLTDEQLAELNRRRGFVDTDPPAFHEPDTDTNLSIERDPTRPVPELGLNQHDTVATDAAELIGRVPEVIEVGQPR